MIEFGRVLAFVFLCGVLGLIEVAAGRALARAYRAAHRDLDARRERRRDARTLRSYETYFAHLDDQVQRGER